ncbi:BTB domain-containing protein [Mycena indigotica]|uniref:BTB domain-containing protein n=1 Tax=Mycena indigotica TaxID=2126181 RepID=A0A8H6VY87_9AGAR|nr:BTB domain-containing protein [Mycena indigotica]KAF7298529.1 BTB domain-containing protein [Mycena indigotica]
MKDLHERQRVRFSKRATSSKSDHLLEAGHDSSAEDTVSSTGSEAAEEVGPQASGAQSEDIYDDLVEEGHLDADLPIRHDKRPPSHESKADTPDFALPPMSTRTFVDGSTNHSLATGKRSDLDDKVAAVTADDEKKQKESRNIIAVLLTTVIQWVRWRVELLLSICCRRNPSPPQTQRKRHPRFFRTDGNIVLCVQSTLYNVHRHYLAPDNENSVFTNRLNEQPATEDNPFVLDVDDGHDFDAFLDRAYLRHEVTSADLDTLVAAHKFSDKYGLRQEARETLKTIGEILCEFVPSESGVSEPLPSHHFPPARCVNLLCFLDKTPPTSISEFLTMYGGPVRHHHRLNRLKRGLEATLLQFTRDRAIPLQEALDIAEEHGFRRLLGELYYLALRKKSRADRASGVVPAPTEIVMAPTIFDLTAEMLHEKHERRILKGFASLATCGQRVANELRAASLCDCNKLTADGSSQCLRKRQRMTSGVHHHSPDLRRFFEWAGNPKQAEEVCCSSKSREFGERLRELHREMDRTLADHFLET